MKAERVFKEYEADEKGYSPDVNGITLMSGGNRLYGYVLTPDKRMPKPYPAVIVSHGFPGYITNNDLEFALMRAGCVVVHANHRGAWGSEGNYFFTTLKDDLIAAAEWITEPETSSKYGIDTDNIFLLGHSIGGMTVLNAAKDIPFVRGVISLAACDIGAIFRYHWEEPFRDMVFNDGNCLTMTSADEVYQDAVDHKDELDVLSRYELLADSRVLFVEATFDTACPGEYMMKPLYQKLRETGADVEYEKIESVHSFGGQRMKLAETVAGWIERKMA